ncbi:MAG: phosphate signaling complex protein PhoU [Halobacteriaceae archaeon]
MTRDSYQDQLETLREDVLYMSEVAVDRLRQGLNALETKDDQLAREVIEGDDELNELYLDVEQSCIDLFALQQPVASDLRFIAASFKISTDLERVGDLAVNLGDYTLEAQHERFPEVDIQSIGDETVGMIETAMEAYATEDPALCQSVVDRDDGVDERCEVASNEIIGELIDSHFDTDDRQAMMVDVSRLLLTVRDLERVGDHAVNIAARTYYQVESDDALIY